jgi:hydroxymethylglutaryl-CoA synthase
MVRALARAGGEAFESLCAGSGVDQEVARRELLDSPRLFEQVNAHGPNIDPNPAAQQLFRDFARSSRFKVFTTRTMELGADLVRELGNLYTASLPAWLAAAFDDAHRAGSDFAQRRLLAVGYGSGDAAEAVPLVVAESWRDAASRIDFERSLAGAVDLDRAQYEALHDGDVPGGLAANASRGFLIADIGRRNDPDWQDIGIEYYHFVG